MGAQSLGVPTSSAPMPAESLAESSEGRKAAEAKFFKMPRREKSEGNGFTPLKVLYTYIEGETEFAAAKRWNASGPIRRPCFDARRRAEGRPV